MLHEHLWPDTAMVDTFGHLLVGGCDLVELAGAHGTPLYLLDEATIRSLCRMYRAGLTQHYAGAWSVHYASKALLNTALLQLMDEERMGLDVVSGGELAVALRAGFPAERIHLHGNAKAQSELEQALTAGVGRIIVDNLDELELLGRMAEGRAVPQPILLRLAPDIAADTHAHIETGRAHSKFGLPLEALDTAATRLRTLPGLRLAGLHAHLGSQLLDLSPLDRAIGVLLDCVVRLRQQHGLDIEELCPGGGLGVPYIPEQTAPTPQAYAAAVSRAMMEGCAQRGVELPRLVIEPGRSIVARAGVALYRVIATKAVAGFPRYIHIDGGMADNIRPALYGAIYTAVLANRASDNADEIVNISGRYCESGDVLLRNVHLPHPKTGDLLAVAVAGAYTLSMASTYNLVPRPPLILIGEHRARLIQRRETIDDLLARDLPLHDGV